jgi:pimeloyl-ACP methyl ester carboxylesterase
MGVRMIAPDRPGIGISDQQPGRKLLDWADDVANLADQLKIEKFGVIGWSGGGPHAFACVRKMPERLTGAATIGSAAPIIPPLKVAEMLSWADRFFMRTSRWAPWLGCAVLAVAARGSRAGFKKSLLKEASSESDRSIIEPMTVSEASDFFFEAIRPGVRWAVDDYRVFAEPWGFELSEIAAPISMFFGVEDPFLPRAHADYMAAHTPGSRLVVCQDRGHFLLHKDLANVLDAVL